MFMRKTDSDIKEIVKQVAKILQDPHTQVFVNAIYGVNLKLTVNSATELSTNLTTDIKGTNQLVGVGMGGSLTGKHFDIIFTDDIINVKDRISRAEREQTKLIYQELQNIKNRGGKIVNTLTIWHADDASNLMPNLVKYDCYHPEVQKIIPPETLKEIKDSMIPSLFACNYELKIIADEDVLFSNPQKGGDLANVLNSRWGHIDAAYGGGDYTAYTTGKRIDGTLYIYGKLWNKHIDDVMDEIINVNNELLVEKMICENNGDKGYVKKEIKRKNGRCVDYHENTNKFLKISTYVKNEWDNIVFVEGTDEEYINQVCDYNINADHDDAPDSLACICRLLYDKNKGKERYQSILL